MTETAIEKETAIDREREREKDSVRRLRLEALVRPLGSRFGFWSGY